MKIKFNKRSIEQLKCTSAQGREFYRDSDCRGLCIEVRSTGGKTYYLSYRDDRGRQRLYKLANAADGRCPELSCRFESVIAVIMLPS